jgi:undecaprenyl-diphosphatase
MHAVSYFQAIVLGLLQGVTELFPVSSLGHTVLFPSLFGWNALVRAQSQSESFWLAFVVMLHVGSALGLLAYYWRDWVAIVNALLHTLVTRRVETPTERLAWLLITASIPTGILGLLFEHQLRTFTAKPILAASFLVLNGLLLLGAERARRRAAVRELAAREGAKADGGRRLDTLELREAGLMGSHSRVRCSPGSAATASAWGRASRGVSITPTRRASPSCSRRRSSSRRACSSCPT